MPGEHELFWEYEGEKIALYGLGTETEKALSVLKDRFEIVGLLDSIREDGELYGKGILSLGRALGKGVRLIIVVARPGSCRAIARKIGGACRESGVALFDIRGKNLLEKKQIQYGFKDTAGSTRKELYKKIDQAEVVSFDLFDTLIMREVPSYTDLLGLMDMMLKEKGINVKGFAAMRLEAERHLANYGAPVLEEIYERALANVKDVRISAAELAAMEWKMDFRSLLPRRAVCDVFSYCVRQGKRVYLVTDTYYRQGQIEEILKKYHLTGYAGLFISCEQGTGKRQELFHRLRYREGERKYLHIGDDLTADIEMASKAGMDTYHIFSGEELLDIVGYMGMEKHMGSLQERLKLGLFTARLFNDPFQFETEGRGVEICDAYDIGYLFCAPVITDFVLWFQEQVKKRDIQNLWFCARDGYLLKQMYQYLDKNAESVYFQTSRIAAIRAGVENEADIAYVDSMKFSGTLKENLKARFGLEAKQDENGKGRSYRGRSQGGTETGLLRYQERIIEKAADERKKYKAYIDTLRIKDGEIAFFDFVAKGTTQMYVQRLLGNHLRGFYFLQLEPDVMRGRGVDIESFYHIEETDAVHIYDNYYVLEPILSAPHPCVEGFDEDGKPLFMEETRQEKEIRCFQRVQEGILDYFRRYLKLLPGSAAGYSKELDGVLLGLIHHLKIQDEDFLSLMVEDAFFNRTTEITELI